MSYRNIVKWQPFNAVAPGTFMVNEVLYNKNKIQKPVLSDDQLRDLEEKIFNAYNNKDIIKIKLYRNGKLYIKEGIIENICSINHKIVLNDGYVIFFSQIVEIS